MQSDVKDKVKRIWCLSATGVKRSSRGLPGSGGGAVAFAEGGTSGGTAGLGEGEDGGKAAVKHLGVCLESN